MFYVRMSTDVSKHFQHFTQAVARSVGEDGTLALCKLLFKHFLENNEDIREGRHNKILVLASAYISEFATLIIECVIDGDENVVKCSSQTSVQRIVATDKYYAAFDGRLHTVPFCKNGVRQI